MDNPTKNQITPDKPACLNIDGWLVDEIRIIPDDELERFFTREADEPEPEEDYRNNEDYQDFATMAEDFMSEMGTADMIIDGYLEWVVKPVGKNFFDKNPDDIFITRGERKVIKAAWKPFSRKKILKLVDKYANEQPFLFGLAFTVLGTLRALMRKNTGEVRAQREKEEMQDRSERTTTGADGITVIEVDAVVVDDKIDGSKKPSDKLKSLVKTAIDCGITSYEIFSKLYPNVHKLSEQTYNNIRDKILRG